MINENIMKTKIISVIAIFSSVSTLVFGVLYFQNNNVSNKSNFTLEIETLQRKIDYYSKVIIAENALLAFEFEEAISLYENLDNSSSEEKIFAAKKIAYIKNLLASKKNGNDRDLLIETKEMMSVAFKKKSDSLMFAKNKQKDSLLNIVAELKEKVALANKMSQNKDNIQVISFKGTKGNQIHYLGEVLNGKANGGGVGIWSNGSIYKGEWKNNIRHGEGSYEWADGVKYVGSYVDGKRKGFGKYYWPSGERYEGQWDNDRRNGYGKLFDPDGNIRFEGNWIEDKPVK